MKLKELALNSFIVLCLVLCVANLWEYFSYRNAVLNIADPKECKTVFIEGKPDFLMCLFKRN